MQYDTGTIVKSNPVCLLGLLLILLIGSINPFTPVPPVTARKKGTCPRFSPTSPGKVIFVPYCTNRLQEG